MKLFNKLLTNGKEITNKKDIENILIEANLAWILDGIFEEAELEIQNNTLIWKNGTWFDGDWEYGIWESGKFKGGNWKSGIRIAGEFYDKDKFKGIKYNDADDENN